MATLIYFIKEAIRGFFEAKRMTFVSIITIATALSFVGIAWIGYVNIQSLLIKANDQADFAMYLTDSFTADSSNVADLLKSILAYPEIKNAYYVDKKMAWDRFGKLYGQEILKSVDDNPLPGSIEIILKERFQTAKITSELQSRFEKLTGVESVKYSREFMDLVQKFRFYFYLISLILGSILVMSLHFMIANTIKLTIYARKELIKNMYMVGATQTFIKMPFIFEGMLQGFVGGVLSIIVLVVLKFSLQKFAILWGSQNLFLFLLLLGILFGWIGSMSAVRKFLST